VKEEAKNIIDVEHRQCKEKSLTTVSSTPEGCSKNCKEEKQYHNKRKKKPNKPQHQGWRKLPTTALRQSPWLSKFFTDEEGKGRETGANNHRTITEKIRTSLELWPWGGRLRRVDSNHGDVMCGRRMDHSSKVARIPRGRLLRPRKARGKSPILGRR